MTNPDRHPRPSSPREAPLCVPRRWWARRPLVLALAILPAATAALAGCSADDSASGRGAAATAWPWGRLEVWHECAAEGTGSGEQQQDRRGALASPRGPGEADSGTGSGEQQQDRHGPGLHLVLEGASAPPDPKPLSAEPRWLPGWWPAAAFTGLVLAVAGAAWWQSRRRDQPAG